MKWIFNRFVWYRWGALPLIVTFFHGSPWWVFFLAGFAWGVLVSVAENADRQWRYAHGD